MTDTGEGPFRAKGLEEKGGLMEALGEILRGAGAFEYGIVNPRQAAGPAEI